ncbi:MAG: DUF2934 domain-containing protein [Gammaproteobacteria bacterium]|jgi:hypothetical protein
MGEKLSADHMSVEMDVLWGRLKELELALSKKLDSTIKSTTSKLKQRLSPAPARRLGDLVISDEMRNELIRKTAYYKAEANGFIAGEEEKNWVEAEEEVNRLLLEGGATLESPEVFTGNATAGKIAAARKTAARPEAARI